MKRLRVHYKVLGRERVFECHVGTVDEAKGKVAQRMREEGRTTWQITDIESEMEVLVPVHGFKSEIEAAVEQLERLRKRDTFVIGTLGDNAIEVLIHGLKKGLE